MCGEQDTVARTVMSCKRWEAYKEELIAALGNVEPEVITPYVMISAEMLKTMIRSIMQMKILMEEGLLEMSEPVSKGL